MKITKELATSLAKEVCKNMHPNDVYCYAENEMARRFQTRYEYSELEWEYGERYDYIFNQD